MLDSHMPTRHGKIVMTPNLFKWSMSTSTGSNIEDGLTVHNLLSIIKRFAARTPPALRPPNNECPPSC